MGVILEVDTENGADFGHESGGARIFVVARHVVAPIDFVDFASAGTGGGSFEIAREGKHGDVASGLVETQHHD